MIEVESTLRESLGHATREVAVPADPWPGFARRERRHRRTRRVRHLFAVGVVAALVGVQTNVVPLPGWAPGIAIASGLSALAQAPPRGTLVGDRAWLEALRGRIGADGPEVLLHDRHGLWEIGDRSRIRLLYGSDVPGHRVALVLVPLRFGVLTRWNYVWYAGPAGADAGQMRYAGHTGGADSLVETFVRIDEEGGAGVAVVVAPTGSTVGISGEPRYTPAGTVEFAQLATPDGSGVGVAVLPPGPLRAEPVVRVERRGEVVHQAGLGGGPYADPFASSGGDVEALLTAAVRDTRGPRPDPTLLETFVEDALLDSGVPATGTAVRVRWSGTVHGQPAVLLTVRPAGGGVIAYAMHGDGRAFRTDLRLLLPAEGADRRPVGWRLRTADGRDRTDQVMVATAGGTVSASVTVDGGAPAPVTLDASGAGTTTVPVGQAATVTAYAADGTVLGSTPVPPFEDRMSGLPGQSPATRVVP